MAQNIWDTIVPSTTSGNQLASLLNDFKDAVVSGFSGTSRPSQLDPGGYWIDTTNDPTSWAYKMYTGVSDVTIFTLDLTTGTATVASAANLFEIAKISADSVGPILALQKKRIAGAGQTLVGDILGEIDFKGTRDDGVKVVQAKLKSLSTNNTTSSQQGSYLAFELITLNGSSLAEVMRLVDGKVGIGTQTPSDPLHVVGSGIRSQYTADDAVGAKVKIKKSRVASSGQVQSGDVVGEVDFLSTDNAGTEVAAAKIVATAVENHTSTAHGTKITISNKKATQSAYTDQVEIADTVQVKTALSVQSASMVYDAATQSKLKVGVASSEAEVATVSHTQTFTNKTLTSPTTNGGTSSGESIQSPTRLDVKKDTEANLTTYAATAANGQWCFATDTKVMYQVIDSALVPAGAGGGGTSLNWNDSGNAPVINWVDGFKLGDFDNTSSQELYAILTVPSSYRAGKPIKLKSGTFFCPSTSGNVLFKTATALIQGSSVLGTYPNIKTSSNSQVAVSGVANTANAIGDLDLTDSSGQINGIAVAAGHKLRIRIYRDNASETSGASENARLVVDSFEPTFS